MKNQNSKITEEYKEEITSILSKISQDLGKSVTDSIEPKISDFTSSLENNFKNTQEINNEQKANIEKATNFFSTLDNKMTSFSEKLDDNDLVEKISADIKVLEQKLVGENSSNKKEVISEIHKGTSQIVELISQQKEMETILLNLKSINEQQSIVLESFDGKANFTNKNLAEIKKSIDVSNEKIEKEKFVLKNAINANNQLIEKTSVDTEEILINQFLGFTTKIRDINNDQLEIQLKETRAKQERIDKFMYVLISIVTIVLVLAVLILLK